MPSLTIEEEDVFRQEGKDAARETLRTGIHVACPYPSDTLQGDIWFTAYQDELRFGNGGADDFEVLGTPTAITVHDERPDGSRVVSIPAPTSK